MMVQTSMMRRGRTSYVEKLKSGIAVESPSRDGKNLVVLFDGDRQISMLLLFQILTKVSQCF
jgi:hypothetical protein